MTIYCVRSSATGANNGTSWTDAWTKLTFASATIVAGDTIYVANDHLEAPSSGTIPFNNNWNSTANAITKFISVNPSNNVASNGATFISTSAAINISGNTTLSFFCPLYWSGFTFIVGNNSATASHTLSLNSTGTTMENCVMVVKTTSGTANFGLGYQTEFINCDVGFGSTSQNFLLQGAAGIFHWRGGSILANTVPTGLVRIRVTGGTSIGDVHFEGVDLSQMTASGSTILSQEGNMPTCISVSNCKLSSNLQLGNTSSNSTIQQLNKVAEMVISDNGANTWHSERENGWGKVITSNTVYRTGGASDGVNPVSFKMDTNVLARPAAEVLDSFEIFEWNSTTGSSKTISIECAAAGGSALKDTDLWADIYYYGNTGGPLYSVKCTSNTDANGTINFLTGNVTLNVSSTASWTGISTPDKIKLSANVTPLIAGYIKVVVRLAKASTTVYVDPLITIT